MIHCTIIGAGQIGSRHLQALCHFEEPLRVDLVDPSDESLQTALDRYQEVVSSGKKNIELYCHHSLDTLPDTLDIVIIANIIIGSTEYMSSADINLDGEVNILDIVALANMILN